MNFVRWLIVGFFWLLGFAGIISGDVISGFCVAAIGFLISPFSNQLFIKQFQKVLPVWGKIVLAVLLFFGYVSTASAPKASSPSTTPTPIVEQVKVIITPEPTSMPEMDPAQVASDIVSVVPTPSSSPMVTMSPTPTPFISPTPTITPTPKATPRPTKVPTPKPAVIVTPKPVTSGGWECDCTKTCPQMSSCGEAQYQLNSCGCSRRDGDNDGIACDSDCQ